MDSASFLEADPRLTAAFSAPSRACTPTRILPPSGYLKMASLADGASQSRQLWAPGQIANFVKNIPQGPKVSDPS